MNLLFFKEIHYSFSSFIVSGILLTGLIVTSVSGAHYEKTKVKALNLVFANGKQDDDKCKPPDECKPPFCDDDECRPP